MIPRSWPSYRAEAEAEEEEGDGEGDLCRRLKGGDA